MYKSPIEIIIGNLQTQMDDDILKAVQTYHINVDKDELGKALRYDRDQYNKGYADGKRDAERVRGEWIYNHGKIHTVPVSGIVTCTNCGRMRIRLNGDELNYCPCCGAKMSIEHDKGKKEG